MSRHEATDQFWPMRQLQKLLTKFLKRTQLHLYIKR